MGAVMGALHVTATVMNPADHGRRWEGLFIVDSGTTDCLLPGNRLREIGIVPCGRRSLILADGTQVVRPAGVATVEVMGELVGATVVFGDDDSSPRLGGTALASAGLEVDSQDQ